MQQRDAGSRLGNRQQQEDCQAGYPHMLLCLREGREQRHRGQQRRTGWPLEKVETPGTAPLGAGGGDG